jgi:hypothetical protein
MAAVQKKTAQLPVLADPVRVGKIKAWANRTNIAAADLVRRALWGPGWDALEKQLTREHGGPLTQEEINVGTLHALPAHLREEFAERTGLRAELASTGRRAE